MSNINFHSCLDMVKMFVVLGGVMWCGCGIWVQITLKLVLIVSSFFSCDSQGTLDKLCQFSTTNQPQPAGKDRYVLNSSVRQELSDREELLSVQWFWSHCFPCLTYLQIWGVIKSLQDELFSSFVKKDLIQVSFVRITYQQKSRQIQWPVC